MNSKITKKYFDGKIHINKQNEIKMEYQKYSNIKNNNIIIF